MLLGIKSDDYTSTLVNVDRWLYFLKFLFGGLAQLARAPALQAGGQRFESVILHFAMYNRMSSLAYWYKQDCMNRRGKWLPIIDDVAEVWVSILILFEVVLFKEAI